MTDREGTNKNKFKKRDEKKIKNKYYKNNIGYLTQRELNNFKINEKITLSDIGPKNKNKKKIKDKTPNQIKTNISLNKCINKLNDKIKNGQVNNNISKNNKIDTNKKKNINKNKHSTKHKNNIIDKLYKNLFLIEFKNNSNYICNNNIRNTIEFNQYSGNKDKINNLSSLIKLRNPFKS